MVSSTRMQSHPSMQQLSEIANGDTVSENYHQAPQPQPVVQESYTRRGMSSPQMNSSRVDRIDPISENTYATNILKNLQGQYNVLAAHTEQLGRLISIKHLYQESVNKIGSICNPRSDLSLQYQSISERLENRDSSSHQSTASNTRRKTKRKLASIKSQHLQLQREAIAVNNEKQQMEIAIGGYCNTDSERLNLLKISLDQTAHLVQELVNRYSSNFQLLVPNAERAIQNCEVIANRVQMLCNRLQMAYTHAEVVSPAEVERYISIHFLLTSIEAVSIQGPIAREHFFGNGGMGGQSSAVHVDQTKNLSDGEILCMVDHRVYIVQMGNAFPTHR